MLVMGIISHKKFDLTLLYSEILFILADFA